MDARLEELRARIDGIDDELIRLLNDRQAAAIDIGRHKKTENHETHIPERERQILDRLKRANSGALDEDSLVQIYDVILRASRAAQREIVDEGNA